MNNEVLININSPNPSPPLLHYLMRRNHLNLAMIPKLNLYIEYIFYTADRGSFQAPVIWS